MAKERVGNTAIGAAVCRLIEQYQPQDKRLFDDPIVKYLLGAPIPLLMRFSAMRALTVQQTDAVGKGIYGAQICRTRYIDDTVRDALAGGITQVVILGAGYDTRPYRLPGIDRARVFELDLPGVQADKKNRLQRHLGKLPDHVTFVPIDFDTQSLDTVLPGAGFSPAQPAIFIWEAVTQYLTEEAVRKVLAFVGQSAPNSLLVFTYILKSVIERRSTIPDAEKMLDTVSKTAPWIFGLEPADLQAYLQPFHLTLVADVGNSDYQAKYLQPLGRTLIVSEAERVAVAKVTA